MNGRGVKSSSLGWVLALARLETRVGLVNDINSAPAAHQLVVTVALDQGLERIANFHNFT
jgi:hypothetical protein